MHKHRLLLHRQISSRLFFSRLIEISIPHCAGSRHLNEENSMNVCPTKRNIIKQDLHEFLFPAWTPLPYHHTHTHTHIKLHLGFPWTAVVKTALRLLHSCRGSAQTAIIKRDYWCLSLKCLAAADITSHVSQYTQSSPNTHTHKTSSHDPNNHKTMKAVCRSREYYTCRYSNFTGDAFVSIYTYVPTVSAANIVGVTARRRMPKWGRQREEDWNYNKHVRVRVCVDP